MRFTKEDAKRLINDLPNNYVVTDRISALRIRDNPKKIYIIEVKDVVLGMVELNKRLIPVFINPKDKRLKLTLMTVEETKKRINYWYGCIETHKKASALLSIYNDVNTILEEEKKVNVQKAVENVGVLNKKLSDLAHDFEPINVTGLPVGTVTQVNRAVEKATGKKYSAAFDSDGKGGSEAYLIHNANAINNLAIIYNKAINTLVLYTQVHRNYIDDFTRVITRNDKQYTFEYVKSLTPTASNIFNKTLELCIAALDGYRKEYTDDVKKCNEVILRIKNLYIKP